MSAHDLSDEDISLHLTTGSYPTIDIGSPHGALVELFLLGSTDRERVECALAIADRIRNAALDLSAQLANGGTGQLRSDGDPTDLPAAGPGPRHGAILATAVSA